MSARSYVQGAIVTALTIAPLVLLFGMAFAIGVRW